MAKFSSKLIAPCGMNCGLCMAYLRKTGRNCPGCRPRGKNCAFMKRNCKLIGKGKVKYCFECRQFPCERLKRLDKRYRTRYGMSMVENLKFIKAKGIRKFLRAQEKKYECPGCGGVVCVHNGMCYECGLGKA